ncbi:protein MEI2-like 2 isoform X2 [Tripterygium wilfordii]|nr:protein MEI2-like 2 isoform X2 [Tripterygium wilfordii]XP_038683333.1 protein MEI2-like 2 isoform X2 [Tripterygium wilfordii]XP_038683334.1 protein MEI2-like 2 isoform X2 [Tripterygium wilfordii]XP_038683335.1 protein MEI2-like 2 isoform X2 [Tripterygium wilfordii]XP_038683336.1 protein MEI2-like 2 isoform X2 [Tripterygium wilfordii]XP_038683337.1 protein MEI2-like 2 isoform X2 [Tripterygium wilfordii]XP_038683338.1 protein MEI2-like 2 isoform X2 [Tripterygium wilfordii]
MAYQASNDASLFSSSLPVLPHEKLNFADLEDHGQSLDDSSPNLGKFNEDESKDELEVVEQNAIGNLLPDDEEELLSGIMDDFDFSGLPSQLEDLEEYDLFGSGGGMELDFEAQEKFSIDMSKLHISDGVATNGIGNYALSNGMGSVSGEHPYGEHPSRTLFVRNINSNVEDYELRALFEQYGDIRALYTACKHRGFVMISYYDIRAARHAMHALQNKPLRRRKLDIHFSIPKDNPSEKDVNQGTLVVFNLDPSVSNDDIRQIFGAYGEVKEIRETPHKRHHKFIEYFDVRAADAALKALNRSDIAGKRIKLEPSRPGGARRSLMHQLSRELDQDEARTFRHQGGSPVASSPPGNWALFGSTVEHNPLKNFSKSPGVGSLSPVNSNNLPGLASVLPTHVSNFGKIAPIGKDQGRANHANNIFTNIGSTQGAIYQHSHSFPEQKLSTSAGLISAFGESNSGSPGIGTLSGPQFLWGSSNPQSELGGSSAWPKSSAGHPFISTGRGVGFPYTSQHGSFLGSRHHVGSAPSGAPLDRHFGFFPESPETSLRSPIAYGGMGINHNNGSYMMSLGTRSAMGAGVTIPGNMGENGPPSLRMMSLPRHNPTFIGNGSYLGPGLTSNEGLAERGRSRRLDNGGNQIDSKKQYQLDLDKIISREDTRTTLMIKNIPNKYTSKMLLAAIDEKHKGTYDFLYLPIDFKNKCNVGYAFINMVSPSHIIPFYEAFNGKKWDKFNSEKVASLAYARIQGKAALVTHFQNSSLMNEDKRCRPILFQSEGLEIGDQEPFLSANLNICIRQPDGSYSGDSLDSPKGSFDEMLEQS